MAYYTCTLHNNTLKLTIGYFCIVLMSLAILPRFVHLCHIDFTLIHLSYILYICKLINFYQFISYHSLVSFLLTAAVYRFCFSLWLCIYDCSHWIKWGKVFVQCSCVSCHCGHQSTVVQSRVWYSSRGDDQIHTFDFFCCFWIQTKIRLRFTWIFIDKK